MSSRSSDPGGFRIDVSRLGVGQRVSVRVTHNPTGVSARAINRSYLRAREAAMDEVRIQLKAQEAHDA